MMPARYDEALTWSAVKRGLVTGGVAGTISAGLLLLPWVFDDALGGGNVRPFVAQILTLGFLVGLVAGLALGVIGALSIQAGQGVVAVAAWVTVVFAGGLLFFAWFVWGLIVFAIPLVVTAFLLALWHARVLVGRRDLSCPDTAS